MKLTNLVQYIPDEFSLGKNVSYLSDSDGLDWYKSQSLFTKKYIIAVDHLTQKVMSVTSDISTLFPSGCDVLEFDEIPDGCNISGNWIFDSEKLVRRNVSAAEIIAAAAAKKATLKAAADSEIDWRQDAVDAGEASKKEISELAAWKKYRVALMRIDISKAPDINWPESPNVA
ncbi:tail fiber assembly protein [Yersinia pseudotuberculosis]|uniref:tail fiber assembly protein n=1 Tax=Yersinia pseudotuberculosis TaxID=633 RepID=UPI001F230EAA|nr:tail fiber assembly protein [Yersinia pseudotuberculosis]MCF1165148.1 tail fiber assembly protein [Yersinia pseudotuberculosis]